MPSTDRPAFRRAAHVLASVRALADDVGVTVIDLDATSALAAFADALHRAEATGVAVPAPSASRDLTVEDAYAVQRLNIRRRLQAGERIVGRKIGLTSAAMQRQLGVSQPDFGVLTDAMVVENGALLDAALLIAPRAEAEFAFRIGRDLPATPSADELWDAIDGVAVAIEIIDSRVADWKITLVDTIADNASGARIVCGDIVPASRALLAGLPDAVISMTCDSDEVAVGAGSAVLGDPLTSLHWLARAIGEFGDAFHAGDIVLAGAVAAAVPMLPGNVFAATSPGLPPVSISVQRG